MSQLLSGLTGVGGGGLGFAGGSSSSSGGNTSISSGSTIGGSLGIDTLARRNPVALLATVAVVVLGMVYLLSGRRR